MITRFYEFYKYGMFNVTIDSIELNLHLDYNENITPIDIKLKLNNNETYDDLSTIIPESKNLDKLEFFINPNLNSKIIDVLKQEGFIQKTNKESIAGDKKTTTYILI